MMIVEKEATTKLLGDVRFWPYGPKPNITQQCLSDGRSWVMPFGHHPTTALQRVPAAPSIGGLRPPTSPADLTYPSIKRYTHGNSKEMKGRHPAYSKFCGS